MICDFNEVEKETDLEADVCIVGGGAVGIALATEYINSGLTVFLLESGGLEHEEETHSEFHVVYQFSCTDPAQLSHIEVLLFTTFPATEELDAQVIGPNGQTAVELTPDSARLSF